MCNKKVGRGVDIRIPSSIEKSDSEFLSWYFYTQRTAPITLEAHKKFMWLLYNFSGYGLGLSVFSNSQDLNIQKAAAGQYLDSL